MIEFSRLRELRSILFLPILVHETIPFRSVLIRFEK
jgi:hypothetical protein